MSGKLKEYTQTGAVADDTPPPPPQSVRAERTAEGAVVVSWQAQADLESGVRCFLIERDGRAVGQVPAKPAGRFGRPLFQTMSYHDTPEAPLPALRFIDPDPPAGDAVYRIRTVNSVGLQSAAAVSR